MLISRNCNEIAAEKIHKAPQARSISASLSKIPPVAQIRPAWGAADEDVKSILETLEKGCGAAPR